MNEAVIALDNQELEDTGESFLVKAGQFMTLGLASASTSAAVGVWNTVKAGVNMFGADLSMTDEAESVRSTFGSSAADYYQENKVGADFGGLLISSVGFGLGAIKGLRGLQAAGKVSGGHQATLGLANGDIVLGSRQVTAYRAAVAERVNYSWKSPEFIGAMGKAAKQNLAEAAVAEGAFILFNNQNALLNPDHLDYIDSSVQILKEGWGFVLGGAAFGTVIDGLRIKGYAAKAFKELNETGDAQSLRLITDQLTVRNGIGGDRLHEVSTVRSLLNGNPDFAVPVEAEGFSAIIAAKDKAVKQLDSLERVTITEMNKADAAGLVAMKQLVETPDEQQRLHRLANLKQVTSISPREADNYIKYYMKQGSVDGADPQLLARVQGNSVDEADIATLTELNRVRIKGNNAAFKAIGNMLHNNKSNQKLFEELSIAAKGDPEFSQRITNLFDKMEATRGKYGRGQLKLAQGAYATGLGDQAISILGTKIAPDYAEEVAELLTDVATKLSIGATGYAKSLQLPRLTGLLERTAAGAIRPFNATRAVYNTRTGTMLSAALPRAHDIGRVNIQGDSIFIAGTPSSYVYRQDAVGYQAYFKSLEKFKGLQEAEHPMLEASTHWAAAAIRGVDKVDIAATDLPRLEAFATATTGRGGSELAETIIVRGADGVAQAMTQAEARTFVIEQKIISRTAMQAAGHSAEEIAVVLNTGERFAMGQAADDVLLMGQMDYTRAESVVLKYKAYSTEEIDIAARTADGLAMRVELERGQRELAASKVTNNLGLGGIYSKLPAEELGLLRTLSQTDQRAGTLTSAQSDFNTIRAWASNVGSLVNKEKDTLRQAITTELHPFYEALTKPEAKAQRVELSFFVNAARTQDYQVFKLEVGGDYTHIAVTKTAVDAEVKRLVDSVPDFDKLKVPEQRDVTMAIRAKVAADIASPAGAQRLTAAKNNTAITMTKDVGELVEWHMARNTRYIANDKALATARGKHVTREGDIFYPPPMNIRRTPFVAFVKPRADDSEAASYMIYAATKEDLDAKMAHVTKGWGKTHRIVTQGEVSEYKAMRGEYDKNRVFDEIDFDPELRNMNKAGSALPSTDLYAAETLDLMRNWHHNKTEHQLMSAVELKYADTVHSLRNADKAFKGKPVGENTERATVFEDTVNLMLDKRSEGGAFDRLYGRVTDAFDNYGSKALDIAGGALVDAWQTVKRGKKFEVSEFEAILKQLDSQGFVNPYSDIGTFISRSEVISDSRTANALGRMLNTVAASLMLRLDWLNSIVQVMSTPIMLSGVVREAMLAAPPKQRAEIANMVTVRNPANGVAEPSMMKIMGEGIRKAITGADKDRAAEALKRGILQDYHRQFMEATDFSSLNGRHTLQMMQEKFDKLATVASRSTLHQRAEDFSRRIVMNAMMDIAERAGLTGDAAWAMVRTGVDKVHGIYRANSRVQLFNGTIGQSMGLFQTYVFNMAQHMARGVQQGRGKDVAVMSALQASIFGVRSLPAYGLLNNLVAETNSGNLDIYSLAGSEKDPEGIASYLLYGLGSNLMVIPTDAFSRGDIAVRHTTVLPLNPLDWPSISMMAKAYGNVVDSVDAFQEGASFKNALAYGLAHNALNRPLQGIGTVALGTVTSSKGTPLFTNSNYEDYDPEQSFSWAAIGARLLGGKPKAEAVALDSYYRRTAYQSSQREETADLGKSLRIAAIGGQGIDEATYNSFFDGYLSAGGTPEGFNGFVGRNMVAAEEAAVPKFKDNLENTSMGRLYGSLMTSRRLTPVWDDDNAALALGGTGNP